MDMETYLLARAFTKKSLDGVGALRGAPCTIKSKTDIPGGQRIVFEWTSNSGTTQTTTLDVMNGVDGSDAAEITGIELDSQKRIVVTLSDGSTYTTDEPVPTVKGDTGKSAYEIAVEEGFPGTKEEWLASLKGEPGDDGFSPEITVKEDTAIAYILHIKTSDDEFDTPNLKGQGDVAGVKGDAETEYRTGLVNITKADIGLGNVDNTSDADKPISDAQRVVNLAQSNTNENFDQRITYLEENPVNPIQFSVMPPAIDHPGEIVQFIGTTETNYTRGYFYRSTPVVIAGDLTYEWQQTNTQPSTLDYNSLSNKPQINGVDVVGNKSGSQFGLQDIIQYAALPVPTADYLGRIVQYIGATTADYKNGYFYQCRYDSESTRYLWVQQNTGTDSDLLARVSANEAHIGDMNNLQLPQTNLVDCINALNRKDLKTVTYEEPNMILTYNDDSTFSFSLLQVFNQTQIGELQNVIDDTIEDGNVLQYNSALRRYQPYAVLTAIANTLQAAKDYADQAVSESIVAGAYVCDEKPEYDAENDTVIYKQDGVVKTTTQTDARFYYHDSHDNSFCTSWINDIEFTFSVAAVEFSDYIRKQDVVNTYTEDMVDKTKIPNIAALDALLTIIKTDYLANYVKTEDVVNNLTSLATDKPLSAKMGHDLKETVDAKQDIMQYAELPVAAVAYLGKVAQYVGATGAGLTKGHFYQCVYDNDNDTYLWVEVMYSTPVDSQLDQNSTNPVQNRVITEQLNNKQPMTLTSPITVDGVQKTTVETALSAINTLAQDASDTADAAQPKTLATTIDVDGTPQTTVEGALGALNNAAGSRLIITTELPTATAALLGATRLLTAAQVGYTLGGVYECREVAGTDPTEYEWTLISANPLEFNSEDFEVENNEVSLDASQKIKTFSQAQWNALTSEEKIALAGQKVIITDDEGTQTFEDIIPSNASSTNKLVTESKIGDLADLETTTKTDVVSAINEVASKDAPIAFTCGYLQIPIPPRYGDEITATQIATLIGKQLSALGTGQGVLLQGFSNRENTTDYLPISVLIQKTASGFSSQIEIADQYLAIDVSTSSGGFSYANHTDSALTLFLNAVGINASIFVS